MRTELIAFISYIHIVHCLCRRCGAQGLLLQDIIGCPDTRTQIFIDIMGT